MPSQKVVFQVARAIRGRMRLKIPRLREDLDFRYRLKTLIEALEGVSQVRLDAKAESVIVSYDPKVLPSNTVEACLTPLIQRAGDRPGDRLAIKFDRKLTLYSAETLTPYEGEQIEEIGLWLSDTPGEFEQGIGEVVDKVAAQVQKLIPDGLAQKIQQSFETVTDDWESDWQHIKPSAGVEDCRQLRQAELRFCDELAEGVRARAVATGAVKGGLSDLAGLLGEGLDLPLSVLLALKTVHKIGLCYGFSPETKNDKHLAWVILALATATTPEDKTEAVKAWHECQLLLYPQILTALVQASIQTGNFDDMLESLARQVVGRIMKKESGGALPVVGAALGAWGEVSLLKDVSLAARRVFQIRWLTDNKKLEPRSAKDKTRGK